MLKEGGTALIGMSPGNSYFKKEKIDEVINYCAGRFGTVKLFIPDTLATHTYQGIGYPEDKARRKARLAANNLRNHSTRSMLENKLENVEIIDWGKATAEAPYLQASQDIYSLYERNSRFREEAKDTTRAVVRDKCLPSVDIESAVEEAVHYLLKELAFITASPQIYNQEKIAYIYHKPWRIYEDYVAGAFGNGSRADLGFLIIR